MAPQGPFVFFRQCFFMMTYEHIAPPADSARSSSLGWVLFAIALSLPWLMPIHSRPWTGFHADVLVAAVFIAALSVVFTLTRGRWSFPASSAALIGLSVVPLLQYLGGLVFFSADAFLASLYLFALGLAVALGARIEARWPGRLAPAVFASFGIAAAASLAIALAQWLQLDEWSGLAMGVAPGGRAVANVAQPNKLATLYVWGLVAFWWAFNRGIVRGWMMVLVAALLLFGIAMTQSRMGALAVLVVMLAAIVHPRALSKNAHRWVVVGLFTWFVCITFFWGALNELLELAPPLNLGERLKQNSRILHWQLIADAVLQRPFLGWGWQQVGVAQSALALQHPATGEVIRSSHNLVLDLVIWNGLPLGLLLTLGLGFWYVRAWRRARAVTEILVMVVLSVFLLHSLLEHPYISATFLLPAGMLVGGLPAPNPADRQDTWSARTGVVALAALSLAFCLTVVTRDYFRVEAAWMAERLRAARIGSLVPVPLPDVLTLGHLTALLEVGRIEPRPGMRSEEIEAIRQVSYRMPGVANMLKLAQAQALNGWAADAESTLARLCRLHTPSNCKVALTAWSDISAKKTLRGGVESSSE